MKILPPILKSGNAKKIFTILLTSFYALILLLTARFIFTNFKKATSVDPNRVSELTPKIDIASIKKASQILEQKTSQIPVSKPKQPSPISTLSPLPTPSATASSFTVQIQNGTNKANIAQEIAKKLEDLGYTIKNISPAESQNYTATTIRLKNKAENNYEEIKQTLYPTFANFVKENLTDQSTVDIVIILGQ
jgi:hypothetical protein